MKSRALITTLKSIVLCMLLVAGLEGAAPWAQTLTQQALSSGFLTRLPVPVCKAFGLPKADEGTDVRQLITKDGHRVHTFNVSVGNHGDVVIFNVDARSGLTVAYLLGSDGALRKAVSYQSGSSDTQELGAAEARAGMVREGHFWAARAKQAAATQ
jgi:hypothetical protein